MIGGASVIAAPPSATYPAKRLAYRTVSVSPPRQGRRARSERQIHPARPSSLLSSLLQAEVIGLHLELAAKQHREQIRTLANRRPVPLSRQEHVAGLARVAHDRLFGHIGHPGGLCERRDDALKQPSDADPRCPFDRQE